MRYLIFIALFFVGCITVRVIPEEAEQEDISVVDPVDLQPSELRIIPGNTWERVVSGDTIAKYGVGLMSQDTTGGLNRETIIDETAILEYVRDSVSGTAQTLSVPNDSIALSQANSVRLPLKVVDIKDSISGNYQVGTIIETRGFSTAGGFGAARYLVQSDSVAGYPTDTVAVIPLESNYAILQTEQDGFLNVAGLGVNTVDTNNSPAFESALRFSKAINSPVKIEEGTYRFLNRIEFLDANYDVHIKGVGDVVFQIDSAEFIAITNKVRTDFSIDSLSYTNSRDSLKFLIKNASALSPGDLLAIEAFETIPVVNDKELVLIEVDKVIDDTTILMVDSILFDVTPQDTLDFIRVWDKHSFTLEGIDFDLQFKYQAVGTAAIVLWGYNGVNIKDMNVINDAYESRLSDGISLYGCKNTNISNTSYKGLRYGTLINNCDQYNMYDAVVLDCRHLNASAGWSRNIYIDNVVSFDCETPIESHVAWNVHYNNVKSNQHGKIIMRGFGDLKITNSDIVTDNTEATGSIYSLIGHHFSAIDLDGTEYERLVQGTNIVIDHVSYIETGSPGKFKGLSATSYKNLVVRNSRSKAIGGYENYLVENSTVVIEDCITGFLQLTNAATKHILISDVRIDTILSTGLDHLIQKSVTPKSYFNNLQLIGTDSLAWLDVWNGDGAAGNKDMIFNNLRGSIKKFANTYTGGSNPNHQILLNNSDLAVSDTIISSAFGGDLRDFITRNNSMVTFSDQTLYNSYMPSSESIEFFSYDTPNKKVLFDSAGIRFSRSADGAYTSYIRNEDQNGNFTDDIKINSRDELIFSSNGTTTGYIDESRLQSNVPIWSSGNTTDLTTPGNDDLTIRAGDGGGTRTGDIIFKVKNLTPLTIQDDGRLLFGAIHIVTGSGSPESVVTAPVGSMYLRDDGGASTTLYVKESGAGNTGWVAK